MLHAPLRRIKSRAPEIALTSPDSGPGSQVKVHNNLSSRSICAQQRDDTRCFMLPVRPKSPMEPRRLAPRGVIGVSFFLVSGPENAPRGVIGVSGPKCGEDAAPAG